MECENGVTRSIIEELHISEIQGYQIAGGSGVNRSIINEFQS